MKHHFSILIVYLLTVFLERIQFVSSRRIRWNSPFTTNKVGGHIATRSKSSTIQQVRVRMISRKINPITSNSAAAALIIRIPEQIWREAALQHRQRIRELLQPGLLPPTKSGGRIQRRRQQQQQQHNLIDPTFGDDENNNNHWITALNPKHPVYNFLIEYYGLKGLRGTKRLLRWSPSPGLLLLQPQSQKPTIDDYSISSMEELEHGSSLRYSNMEEYELFDTNDTGVLLEGATSDDFANVLHLRGATIVNSTSGNIYTSPYLDNNQEQQIKQSSSKMSIHDNNDGVGGVLYSPSQFFGRHNFHMDNDERNMIARKATSFSWYRSILQQTLIAEPILHCHGLHEWAMQYHPVGEQPPPSAKYQLNNMPLRVSRTVINDTVERRGISCTHVDALRFFAPAAGPLNHHGSSLERMDQLRLEQPACVHAHMDLLKIALKLSPFVDPALIRRILEIALESRRLDVAASPYDASEYDVGVVPVETAEGRRMYRKQQKELMKHAEPIRRDLLTAYETFLTIAFDQSTLTKADDEPMPERFAKAEPGGLPWRKSLLTTSSSSNEG